MATTDWDLHDGVGTFGAQRAHNPYDRQLLAAFNELADATAAIGVTASIGNRIWLRNAQAQVESAKSAHRRWHEENR